jgi:hypothetical protein
MNHDQELPGLKGPYFAIGLLVISAAAGYFMLTGHYAHIVRALPYLLLFACPLMHVFMHRGHGGQGAHHHPHGSEDGQVKRNQGRDEGQYGPR